MIASTAFVLPSPLPALSSTPLNSSFPKSRTGLKRATNNVKNSTFRRQRYFQFKPITCNAESTKIPDSPASLVKSWKNTRSIASTVDLSRRFVSVLFLSNNCQRACISEKVLTKIAETYSISRRLLILSAGIYSKPGDLLPLRLVSSARDRNVDLSDERPCASFEITDFDRDVKDKLLQMAEVSAHTTGGHLYKWERKIRLLCDFDGSASVQSTGRRGAQPLDVPLLDACPDVTHAINIISGACEQVVCSLLAAGL